MLAFLLGFICGVVFVLGMCALAAKDMFGRDDDYGRELNRL